MDTADEKIMRRATVESEQNAARDLIEKNYVAARNALEAQYHKDLRNNRLAKEAALVAAGLNFDGGDPQGRQQGLVE